MNTNKICFITCVNDERVYRESVFYINHLDIPAGFEVQMIQSKNASSMTQGYNSAMNSSDAKYKVYFHQDVFIINKNFIHDVIRVFKSNRNIGMMGVAGSKDMPASGIWWESRSLYGAVYGSQTDRMELLQFEDVHEDYFPVQCVDGLILITQYDVPWREDLFTGWHFYDISQSMEFSRVGYKVAIPRQEQPWCIHDCGIVNVSNGYDHYRRIFLDEYSKDLFPLVSILIPAYNQPVFLEAALKSALNQEYRNCEIIICDDSTTDDVRCLISRYQEDYTCIKYYNNGGPLGGKGALNVQKCFDICHGQYISFLFHDDIYMPNKINTMLRYLLDESNIKMVTSYRRLIDDHGRYLPDLTITQPLVSENTKISGYSMGNFILKNIANVIGELTTVMFRKSDICGYLTNYYGYNLRCLGDVALWLKLIREGDLVYIREPLSCFRIHDQQNTYNTEIQLMAAIDWYRLIEISYQNNIFIQNKDDYCSALKKWMTMHKVIIEAMAFKCEKELYREFIECYQTAQMYAE